MSGYQEILTDPSYCRQIVTPTYPHIGNTGINRRTARPRKVYAAGLVIRDLPLRWLQLAQRAVAGRLSQGRKHRRHRRHRYPQADPHPAREGCPGGCIVTAATADELMSKPWPRPAPSRPGRNGSGQGGRPPSLPRAKANGARAGLRRQRRMPVSTSWPTTSASSATSCACWPSAAAADRRAGADAGGRGASRSPGRRLPVQRPGDPGALRLPLPSRDS